MKSGGLLEMAFVAPAPAKTEAALTTDGNLECEPFGKVLEQVTAETDAEVESEVQPETEGEEPDEQDDTVLIGNPLLCYCPPPEVIEVAEVRGGGEGEGDGSPVDVAMAPAEAESGAGSELWTAPPSPDRKDLRDERPLHEALRVQKLAEAKAPLPAEESAGQGVALDPELFTAVAPEKTEKAPIFALELSQRATLKAQENRDGMLAAKQSGNVQNTEKTAENAAATEQFVPAPEGVRRAAPERARFNSFQITPEFEGSAKTEFEVETVVDLAPAPKVDAAKLVESIRTEVANLRLRGDVSMSVVLRPDNGTELRVDVTVGRDGVIQATARCEKGDVSALTAQWPQLQQSLATQGIRMTDLSGHGQQPQQQPNSGRENFQNFERGQNSRQQQQDRPAPSFEHELNLTRAGGSKTPLTDNRFGESRRWQSWA